ncbi:unnamed protein product [Rotaria magnacalcarata]|uniref:Uncharacterized protein n=3 Tax=Rotaria magnacalcarata TaxID=392030 RepID=A0A815D2T1_9BILA|nr:unnamed protein product [Rotaria magnacalcarata]CAF2055469.1 unnamed protein product [Rotaria magnacalcarata]
MPMCLSFDNTARLYDSFAEIHQEYTGPMRFQQNDWNNIKHESIILRSSSDDNVNETTTLFERRVLRIAMNMTGKKVLVRRYPEHKKPVVCEIINEDYSYSLVREIETGHYFRVQSNLIEYNDEPQPNTIYEVSFHPLPANDTFIVSYVIKNIRWQARYTLQTYPDRSTRFQIIVDIINSSPLNFHFNQTHLMAGDIDLTFSTSSSLVDSKTQTKNDIDYSGINLFTCINNSLTIDPYSILTLPIESPNIQIKTIFTYNLIISIPSLVLSNATSMISNKHKLQRVYQISNSSLFLPTGHLMLYDSSLNVLTGEWHLPTLTEFEKYEFKLGEDPDIMLEYNRTTTNDQKTNSSIITTNVLIQNYKQRSINIRFKSTCESSMICLYYDDKARSLGSRLNYELYLKTKSEVLFSFTTIRLL